VCPFASSKPAESGVVAQRCGVDAVDDDGTRRVIHAWNDRCAPFTWTNDPNTLIAKATPPRRRKTQTTSVTEH
jgi:hypothetical protein